MMQTQMHDRASYAAQQQLAQLQSLKAVHNSSTPGAAQGPMPMQWLALVLDEIDYGVLLVSPSQQVLYSNHTARRELLQEHPLRLDEDRLCARLNGDALALREALHAATQRGLRRLLALDGERRPAVVAIVPLAQSGDDEPLALLLLGKRSVCESLSAQGFARCHGLTPTERDVLAGLCAGHPPRRIAHLHGVSLATVRTQIASIRGKTGTASIRDLLEQVAQLPPLVGALRDAAVPPAPPAWSFARGGRARQHCAAPA